MPKLIDYPRTSYTGAWELAEIVDDTGGKSSIETAARKLNRKVSGSFKAIIGSAVKFGLMTSKRELLTTTTLFRRIKHAYDKAEELQFHREAFLTPPLFTQLCRKFRNRELPVQMLDVMLIREFGVEEINAQNVAKAFVDGCRMCGLLDERNIIADIDALSNARAPRREIASTPPNINTFTAAPTAPTTNSEHVGKNAAHNSAIGLFTQPAESFIHTAAPESERTKPNQDVIANLFGLSNSADENSEITRSRLTPPAQDAHIQQASSPELNTPAIPTGIVNTNTHTTLQPSNTSVYQMQMSGPGVNTILDITDEADLAIAIAMLEKIRRQLRANQ
ncbi:hypothetical protein GCM10022409_04980 [Hymenobacter glaciei]|uniref:Uncharacterized protein n=1 Tax=Hymenobacter glaciei TaxID=877209 RepID=A0ABP7TBW0_9BACT